MLQHISSLCFEISQRHMSSHMWASGDLIRHHHSVRYTIENKKMKDFSFSFGLQVIHTCHGKDQEPLSVLSLF